MPYLKNAGPDRIAVILKGREPARILVAIGGKDNDSPHLEYKQRWVNQYNFYLNDKHWGPLFVRMCPYFPFSARVCLNQHYWLAIRMRQQKIDFQQCKNAFLRCSHPEQLQELADSLTARDVLQCGLKWLATFTPFFTERERREAICQHRLFFAQAEYCDNLLFFRRAAVDQLEQRKQYVRDNRLLRTEPATNDVRDYGVNKDVANLPKLRQRMSEIIDNYHNAQQDILETFVDRGQLRKLAEPTILANGKRIPGLKLDHPRQLAVMHALVRFANLAAADGFRSSDIHPAALKALGAKPSQYTLSSFRYDLSKLRAKGLVERIPHSRRYRLVGKGYSLCLVFLKLFERIYAPLTAGLLKPFPGDRKLAEEKRSTLDRLYQRIVDDLDELLRAVGLKAVA